MFHMPFFFFLSGLCFNINGSTNTSFKTFAGKRAKRLLLPALIASVVICIVANSIDGYNVDLTKRLPDANWFFLTLFFAQLAYYPIAKYCKDWKVTASVLIVLYIASCLMSMNGVRINFNFEALPSAICYYGLGHLLRKHILPIVSNEKRCLRTFSIGLVLCGLVLLWVIITRYQYMMCENDTKYPWAQIIVSFIGIMGLMFVSTVKLPERILGLAKWIGANTIVIVGYHLMIVKLASHYIAPLISTHLAYKVIEQILIWSICLIMTVILNRYAKWAVGK